MRLLYVVVETWPPDAGLLTKGGFYLRVQVQSPGKLH